MRREISALVTMVAALAISQSASALMIGGYTFSGEEAFVDDATYLSGDPTYIQHPPGTDWTSFTGNTTTDLDAALTGSDITLGVDGGGMATYLEFTDNLLVNGAGDDLVIFETIAPESFQLALYVSGSWTSLMTFTPTSTGQTVGQNVGTTNSGALNAAAIDLDVFGLADGATVSLMGLCTKVGCDSSPGTLAGADIVAIGALNSAPVPEPATLGLMGIGLAAVGFARRKRTA
jgi:hypothetical protein